MHNQLQPSQGIAATRWLRQINKVPFTVIALVVEVLQLTAVTFGFKRRFVRQAVNAHDAAAGRLDYAPAFALRDGVEVGFAKISVGGVRVKISISCLLINWLSALFKVNAGSLSAQLHI